MRYSIWNQGAGAFDYYEDDRVQDVLNVEKPSHLVSRTLGSTVDQAGWPLPATARHVGRGEVPVGRVAVRPGAAALAGFPDFSLLQMTLLGVAGIVAWRFLRRSR